MMDNMQKLQREIEALRKRLDVEVETGLLSQKCYLISVRLDRLIEEYMQYKESRADSEKAVEVLRENDVCEFGRVDFPCY